MTHLLIVSAPFYADIAAALRAGAEAALKKEKATYDVVEVPGALEISHAIRFALETKKYDGYVALGCVMRGETYHFEVVSNESARGLTWLGIEHKAAIGNGILTVENMKQAKARAKKGDKGGEAARAALALIALKKKWNLQ